MQQEPRQGDTISIQDFQQLLLTNYLQAKRIATLEAELAMLKTLPKEEEKNGEV